MIFFSFLFLILRNQRVSSNIENSNADNNNSKNDLPGKATLSKHSIVIPNKSYCHSNVLIPMDQNKKLESESNSTQSLQEFHFFPCQVNTHQCYLTILPFSHEISLPQAEILLVMYFHWGGVLQSRVQKAPSIRDKFGPWQL